MATMAAHIKGGKRGCDHRNTELGGIISSDKPISLVIAEIKSKASLSNLSSWICWKHKVQLIKFLTMNFIFKILWVWGDIKANSLGGKQGIKYLKK